MNTSQDSRPADAVGLRQEAEDTAAVRPDLGVSQSAAPSGHGQAGPVENGPTYMDARFAADCLATFTRDRLRVVRPGSTEESDLRAIRGHLAIVGALFTNLMTETARSEARTCEAVGQGGDAA